MIVFMICTILLIKAGVGEECASGQLTASGRCCSTCPPGSGAVRPCAEEDTVCAPCLKGSFSPSAGLEPCLPCARCMAGVSQLAPCSAARDTHCDCQAGFYLWREGREGLCAPCSMCERGSGVNRTCDAMSDTQCLACLPGSFSEERSLTKPCLPCTQCRDGEVEIRACLPHADALCMDKKLLILSRPSGPDGASDATRWPLLTEEGRAGENGGAGPVTGTPDYTSQGEGGSSNIVIYVSVLAAVVLGLLLYVAYKCWRSCQQKKALSKARAAELGVSPEGEKLHSDSGVFLDSHSLQDTQPTKGSKRDSKYDSRLYVNLPPHRREELERLLQDGRGWRPLGAALGYPPEQLDLFGRGEAASRTLLSDWAQQEGSSLGLLSSALARIDRPDLVALLNSPTQGTSVV